MAFPVVEEAVESSTNTAGTSHVVTLPTATAGHLLLIILDKGSTSATVNSHASLTELLDEDLANGLYIAYRQMDGTEPADYTLTTSASTRSARIAYRISGHINPAAQAPQIGTTGTGTSATPDPPSSAAPASTMDYLFIALAGMAGEEADDDTWGNTPPTNYTPSPPRQKSCGVAGTNLGGLILSAERQLNTGAAQDPGTFGVDSSAAWRSQTILITPANPQSVTPGVASLTTARFAPTVATPSLVTPPKASLVLATFAPTVTASSGPFSFTDDFERASLGSNWTQRSGTPQIYGTSDLGADTIGTVNIARWAGTAFSDDHSSEITISAVGVGEAAALGRINASGSLSYYQVASTSSYFELSKTVAGSYTLLTDLGTVPGVNDRVRLECQGTTLRVYLNDTLIDERTDSSIASGQPGAGFWHGSVTPTARVEEWSGADLTGITVTPGKATLTTARFAPTVLAPRLVTPANGALVLAGLAPTVTASAGISLTPATASLVASGFAPSVLTPRLMVPAKGSLALAAYEPSVAVSLVVAPGPASLALASSAPTVATTSHQLVTPGIGSLMVSGYAPAVTATGGAPPPAQPVEPGLGAFTLGRIKQMAWEYGGMRFRK